MPTNHVIHLTAASMHPHAGAFGNVVYALPSYVPLCTTSFIGEIVWCRSWGCRSIAWGVDQAGGGARPSRNDWLHICQSPALCKHKVSPLLAILTRGSVTNLHLISMRTMLHNVQQNSQLKTSLWLSTVHEMHQIVCQQTQQINRL